LPGFVALAGIAPLVPTVAGWLKADQSASFGAPLYALLAATAAGMVVSCFRWLILDWVHVLTGVTPPTFNARALAEQHYRFYQFYGNLLIAVLWSYSIFRWLRMSSLLRSGTDIGVLILCGVLFAGSRDAISKYRERSRQLIGQSALIHSEGEIVTNGIDHHQGDSGRTGKPPVEPKPEAKPEKENKPKEVQGSKQSKG